MRFTAFAEPEMSRTAHTIHRPPAELPPHVVPTGEADRGVDVGLHHHDDGEAERDGRDRPSILAVLFSPRFRSLETLIQSSTRPTSPAPATAPMHARPVQVNRPVRPNRSETTYPATAPHDDRDAHPWWACPPSRCDLPGRPRGSVGRSVAGSANGSAAVVPSNETTTAIPAASRSRIMGSRPGEKPAAAKLLADDLTVVEGLGAVVEHLALFVTLAGDHDHVARSCGPDGETDRGATIWLDSRGIGASCTDLVDDAKRVLRPGVVGWSRSPRRQWRMPPHPSSGACRRHGRHHIRRPGSCARGPRTDRRSWSPRRRAPPRGHRGCGRSRRPPRTADRRRPPRIDRGRPAAGPAPTTTSTPRPRAAGTPRRRRSHSTRCDDPAAGPRRGGRAR